MSIAARVAQWQKKNGGVWATPTSISSPVTAGGGSAPAVPKVELDIGITTDASGKHIEEWTEITSYVLYDDGIKITRGATSAVGISDPQQLTLTVDNRDGRFSPRNTNGAWFQRIGLNTHIRVSRGGQFRFYGEVSQWSRKRDDTGLWSYVEITASGPLRRMGTGSNPLSSAMYREITRGRRLLAGGSTTYNPNPPFAYWPMEDGSTATQFASAIQTPLYDMKPQTVSPTFSTNTTFQCSDAIPDINGSTLKGTCSDPNGSTAWSVQFLFYAPNGMTANTRLMTVNSLNSTSDSVGIIYNAANQFSIDQKTEGTEISSGAGSVDTRLSTPILVTFGVTAANSIRIYIQSLTDTTATLYASVGASIVSLFTPKEIIFNTLGGAISSVFVGHCAAYGVSPALVTPPASLNAYLGETAGTRFARLCTEEGVAYQINGTLTNTTAMGYQGLTDLPSQLRQCEASDGGLMAEGRDFLGITYRTRQSLYGQPTTLSLNYSNGELSGSYEPDYDDQYIVNNMTVTRTNGSSATIDATVDGVQFSDRMGSVAPPFGVSQYADSLDLSLGADSQAVDQASWRVLQGTVDQDRYPSLSVAHENLRFAASADLRSASTAMNMGDKVVVSGLPEAPTTSSQIIRGYTETMDQFTNDIEYVCSPSAVYDSSAITGTARADANGSILAEDALIGDTSLQVTAHGAGADLWIDSATYASDFPFDILIGGEQMTVTAITGTTSPQTFTVTRGVNGTTEINHYNSGKALAYVESVHLATPAYMPL